MEGRDELILTERIYVSVPQPTTPFAHPLLVSVFLTSFYVDLIFASTSSNLTDIQFSSVTQSCPTLCNPVNRSTPGLLVHHQLRESTQTHVRRVGNAIQPSHPPAPNPSQH